MSKRTKQQEETEAYLSRIKLKEIFQVRFIIYAVYLDSCISPTQGLLTHAMMHQPEDPMGYFHQELTKMKKEMADSNVCSSLF